MKKKYIIVMAIIILIILIIIGMILKEIYTPQNFTPAKSNEEIMENYKKNQAEQKYEKANRGKLHITYNDKTVVAYEYSSDFMKYYQDNLEYSDTNDKYRYFMKLWEEINTTPLTIHENQNINLTFELASKESSKKLEKINFGKYFITLYPNTYQNSSQRSDTFKYINDSNETKTLEFSSLKSAKMNFIIQAFEINNKWYLLPLICN